MKVVAESHRRAYFLVEAECGTNIWVGKDSSDTMVHIGTEDAVQEWVDGDSSYEENIFHLSETSFHQLMMNLVMFRDDVLAEG
jgi:hypothetical protein